VKIYVFLIGLFIVAIMGGMIATLITRLKEIDKEDKNDLSKQLQDNVQFCLSLKNLIKSGVDKEILSTLLEKLCIRAESIEKLYHLPK
jgi:hypothetical protein